VHDSMDLSVPPLTSLVWERVQVRLLLDEAVDRITVALNPLIRVIEIVESA